MFPRLLSWLFGLLAAASVAIPAAAQQSYPSKSIRLVPDMGTGGAGDITSRLFARHAGRSTGQAKIERR